MITRLGFLLLLPALAFASGTALADHPHGGQGGGSPHSQSQEHGYHGGGRSHDRGSYSYDRRSYNRDRGSYNRDRRDYNYDRRGYEHDRGSYGDYGHGYGYGYGRDWRGHDGDYRQSSPRGRPPQGRPPQSRPPRHDYGHNWHGKRYYWHGRPYWRLNIRYFPRRDYGVWIGGYWHHGWYGGQFGWWWVAGGAWYYYPAPIYPYPNPYVPGGVVVVQQEQQPQPPAPPAQAPVQYWYHCKAPEGYYPYVPECPGGWTKVPATPPPASAPSAGSG